MNDKRPIVSKQFLIDLLKRDDFYTPVSINVNGFEIYKTGIDVNDFANLVNGLFSNYELERKSGINYTDVLKSKTDFMIKEYMNYRTEKLKNNNK